MLLFACSQILGGYVHDTVGINGKEPSKSLNPDECVALGASIQGGKLAGWLSAAVEKIWLFLVGMVVFLSISLVATPPMVSMDV